MKSKVARKAAAAGETKSAAKEPAFDNRRARFEYEKLESLEVGIALSGTEIKSIRNGNLSLNEGFARLRDGELWLVNFTIPPYKEGSIFNHEPGRPRKLLLHKEQLERLTGRARLAVAGFLAGGRVALDAIDRRPRHFAPAYLEAVLGR